MRSSHPILRRVFRRALPTTLIFIFSAAVMLTGWEQTVHAAEELMAGYGPWWVLPLALLGLTLVLGVLAVLAGIGGSVLYVPLVSGFAPFLHIDFVRGAGLLVALSGALSAGPDLLRQQLVNLRLAIPISLVASCASIFGALVGLAMPQQMIQLALGFTILGMASLMVLAKPESRPEAGAAVDPLAGWLNISGVTTDPVTGEEVTWHPKRLALGFVLFSGVGFMAGMFGLGAGWANVPVLNLAMGVPLKTAVATSYFLLAITDTTAAWVYINRGAVLPLIVVPSVVGIMIGARVGARLLVFLEPAVIRRIVIGVLLLASARSLLRGFGI